jgi:hypothetical protein
MICTLNSSVLGGRKKITKCSYFVQVHKYYYLYKHGNLTTKARKRPHSYFVSIKYKLSRACDWLKIAHHLLM